MPHRMRATASSAPRKTVRVRTGGTGNRNALVTEIAAKTGYDANTVAVDAERVRDLLYAAAKKTLDVVRLAASACAPASSTHTLTADHFRLPSRMTRAVSAASGGGARKTSPQRGGRTVLPMEWFGAAIDTTNYVPASEAPAGHAPWSDPDLARTALPASPQMPSPLKGGASATGAIDAALTSVIKEYNDKTGGSRVRLTDDAKPVFKRLVMSTVLHALRHGGGGGAKSRLTATALEKAKSRLAVQFDAA